MIVGFFPQQRSQRDCRGLPVTMRIVGFSPVMTELQESLDFANDIGVAGIVEVCL